MKERSEGTGRRDPTSQEAGRPDQKQTPQQRGEGIRGVPPPPVEPAKPQQERGKRQRPPGVWEVLERRERLAELRPKRFSVYPDGSIHPRPPDEFYHEQRELNRLSKELREKGIPRDKLILELGAYPRLRTRGLSPQEDFQKFRSDVELMSDEEIAKEIRRKEQFRGAAFTPGVGLSEILTGKKGKQE